MAGLFDVVLRDEMKRSYCVKDDESEIRIACNYLEGLGFIYSLENDFVVKYESKDHSIFIEYERYGVSVFVDIVFKNPKYKKEKYSVAWSAKVDKEVEFEKYVAKPYSKIHAVRKRVEFIRDYPEKIFSEEYCHKMKLEYDNF